MTRRFYHILAVLILGLNLGTAGWLFQGASSWRVPVDITSGVTTNVRSFEVMGCDRYQNVHLFWADQSDDGAAIFYRNDINDTWSFPVDVIAVKDSHVYYLRVVISQKSDLIHLSWVNSTFDGTLYYASAPLHEAGDPSAWSKPRVLSTGVTNSDMALDSQDRLHLIYSYSTDETGINNEVFHMVSADQGATWSDPDLVYSRTFTMPSSIQTWMAIDGADRIHIGLTLRSQEYGVTSEVGYIQSTEDGGWSDYRMVEETGTTAQGVAWIAPYAFGSNEIHLTWHDPRRMHQYSLDGGKTWSQPEEIMPLGGAFGGPNELVKDSQGRMHVVLAVADGVYSVEWNNRQWGAPEQIDSRYIDPHGQHILVCQGNQMHITYYDRTGPESVWYTTKQLDGPHYARGLIPQLDSASTSKTAIQATPSPTPIPPTRTPLVVEPGVPVTAGGTTKVATLLLVGVTPGVLVVLGILLFYFLRQRR